VNNVAVPVDQSEFVLVEACEDAKRFIEFHNSTLSANTHESLGSQLEGFCKKVQAPGA